MNWGTTVLCLAATGLIVGGTYHASAQTRAQRNGVKWDYTTLERVPDNARAKQNPFEGDPKAVASGQKLFTHHCVECHGENLGGSDRGINLMSEEVLQASPGALFWVITNGIVRHGMPVWSNLPEPQRWQIVSFLKSVGAPPLEESKPSPPEH